MAAITSQSTGYISDADLRQVLSDVASYARRLEQDASSRRRSLSLSASESSLDTPSPGSSQNEPSSDDDDLFVNGALIERFERFVLDSYRNRFFGKSSHVKLIKTAVEAKKKVEDNTLRNRNAPTRRSIFWRSPVRFISSRWSNRYSCLQWEHDDLTLPQFLPPLIFPEPDLLQSLVTIYFSHVNIFTCLLHQPTFETGLRAGYHLADRQFGATVMAVCAVAAKYSDDPRVLMEGTNTQLSSGWKYIRQVQPIRTSLIRTATLYEAQLICVQSFHSND